MYIIKKKQWSFRFVRLWNFGSWWTFFRLIFFYISTFTSTLATLDAAAATTAAVTAEAVSGRRRAGAICFFRRCCCELIWGDWEFDEIGDRGLVFSGLVGIIIAGGDAGGLYLKDEKRILSKKSDKVPAGGHVGLVVVIVVIDWLILER